jgi:AcrR family transcriptional regulator
MMVRCRGMAVPSGSRGGTEQARAARSLDLRERKRARTRLMIQTEALRLFAEKGYAHTTVEEIADAATISPRTFFRYFPSKEDVVFWDEHAPLVLDLLEPRPDDEPLAETFRGVIREGLGGLYRRDPERLLSRVRLYITVPELRVRLLVEEANAVEQLATLLARRRGARTEDLRLRVIGSSLLAAASVALDLWQEDNGKSDLMALLDQATDALAEAMSELQSSPRQRNAPAKARSPRR